MKILSLDLSTKSSGWAIYNNNKLENHGCITASSTNFLNRINKIINEINEILLKNTDIEKVIVEEVRPEVGSNNLHTHKTLMYLQAAVAFLLHDRFTTIDLEFLYPSEWRAKCGIKNGRRGSPRSCKTI